jgi:hypothetical protein
VMVRAAARASAMITGHSASGTYGASGPNG